MQIMALRLKRFKSFVEEEFRPAGELTVLVGRNNSGKSNLIDAVRLFRAVGEKGPVAASAIDERGGMSRIAFQGSGPVEVELEGRLQPGQLAKLAEPAQPGDHIVVALSIGSGPMQTAVGTKSGSLFAIGAWGRYSRADGWFDGETVRQELSRIYYLGPRRAKPEDVVTARGETELDPDAGNILKVLNTLATRQPPLFSKVVDKTRELLPEVSHILAPLVLGQAQAQGVVRESGLGEYELLWSNIADGSRQIMALVTFLVTTPPDSVLLMEEPELSLHPYAALKVVDIMKGVAASDQKQIILSTHSPVIVEACGLASVRLVVRSSDGQSHASGIDNAKKIEAVLADRGVLRSFMLTPHQPGVVPRFQLIVEGKDDAAVWEKWLSKAQIGAPDAVIIRADGEGEGEKLAVFLKFLRESGFAETAFLLVVDGGADCATKHSALSAKLADNDFHVLSQTEIDDYLVDAAAIAAVLSMEIPKVQQAIASVGGQGKPRLKAILGKLGHKEAGTEVKALIANAMDHLPEEMKQIINQIRSVLKSG